MLSFEENMLRFEENKQRIIYVSVGDDHIGAFHTDEGGKNWTFTPRVLTARHVEYGAETLRAIASELDRLNSQP